MLSLPTPWAHAPPLPPQPPESTGRYLHYISYFEVGRNRNVLLGAQDVTVKKLSPTGTIFLSSRPLQHWCTNPGVSRVGFFLSSQWSECESTFIIRKNGLESKAVTFAGSAGLSPAASPQLVAKQTPRQEPCIFSDAVENLAFLTLGCTDFARKLRKERWLQGM